MSRTVDTQLSSVAPGPSAGSVRGPVLSGGRIGFLVLLTLAVALAWTSAGARAQDATDRLGQPGPISFGGTPFRLTSSTEPTQGYRKQAYLPAGEELERYRSMVLLEFLAGDRQAMDMARSQAEMLAARRGSDPLLDVDVFVNDAQDEVILDFLMSAQDSAGQRIVEWNGYRYAAGRDADGVRGGWLLGISRRAYGDEDIAAFLAALEDRRGRDVESLAAASVPFP